MLSVFPPFRKLFCSPRARRSAGRCRPAAVSYLNRSEPLAPRVMLAGNVTAELVGSTLRIFGDAEDNVVTVDFEVVDNASVVRVAAGFVSMPTTINGEMMDVTFDAADISFIRIETGDGADEVVSTITTDGTPWANEFSLQTLLVDLGRGEDFLDLNGSNVTGNEFSGIGTIEGGLNDDEMIIDGWSFGDDVRFRGVGGNDFMCMDSVTVGGTLRLRTNDGVDELDMFDVTVLEETRVAGGAGSLLATIDGLTSYEKITVRGNSGMDSISMLNTASLADLTISTFAGNDLVRAENLFVAGQTQVVAGDGDDYIFANGGMNGAGQFGYLSILGQLFVNGQAGDDSVVICAEPGRTYFGGNVIARGEDDIDFLTVIGEILSPDGTQVVQSFEDVDDGTEPGDDGTLANDRLATIVTAFSNNFGHVVNESSYRC